MNSEALLPQRSFILLCVLLVLFVSAWLLWRSFSSPSQQRGPSAVAITKQPVAFATHSFDSASPPSDMPSLSAGEAAECDSDFTSSASVRGETQPTDSTRATVTITQVKMILQLRINIWLPNGANQHLTEHEDGHRQISESYYKSADQLAQRIASTYIGRRIEITGTDLASESNKTLQQMASEITAEYGKQLNPNPAQLLYDSITDHGRNDASAADAVSHALKNVLIEGSSSQ